MDKSSSLKQFILFRNSEELSEDTNLTFEEIQSKFNNLEFLLEENEGESTIRLIGKKSNILKFLNFFNSQSMGMGESEEDWEELITSYTK